MPTYPVINKVTGEKKELSMTMKEYSDWKDANPDWDKDWNAGVGGMTYGAPKQSDGFKDCLLYTSPSPRDRQKSRMPSSA